MALGKIVFHKHPALAEELMSLYSHPENETKLELIPRYYEQICQFMEFQPQDLRGRLANQERMRSRRLFFAAIIHLYCREVFNQPCASPVLKFGIVKKVSECVLLKKAYSSQLFRQVLFEYKNYDEFKSDVDQLVKILQPSSHGDA